MTTDINYILNQFDPINLREMDSVKLMDRTDTKFIFHRSRLSEILTILGDHYRSLQIGQDRNNYYETLYFDTNRFDLYLSHHNERTNRYKIRFRNYTNSNLYFFEIKFKNNKGRTIKNRVQRPQIEENITDSAKALLEDTTSLSSDLLRPVFWVNYSRITLVSNNMQERLTIDTNLTFKNQFNEKVYSDIVIAELKQDKASSKSIFNQIMNQERIRQNSISKYCLGVTQLVDDVKKNNFKPKLLTLNKIIHGTA